MTTLWDENKPAATDPLSEFPSVMTRQAIAFREGIEKHFHWTESSGASAGEPRFSSLTTMPGSARGFFGTQSQVSAARDGTVMVTSDTSRLFATPSASSVLLGTRSGIITYSSATIPSNTKWVVQSGSSSRCTDTTLYHISFSSAYSGTPFLEAMPLVLNSTSMCALAVQTVDSSGFSFFFTKYGSTVSFTILWRSHGTMAL
jgi:hypothetical protein